MVQGNDYDSFTRKEKDAYLWWVNVDYWRNKNQPELDKMDRKTKNEMRRWRKRNSRLSFESSGRLDARKVGGVNIEADGRSKAW